MKKLLRGLRQNRGASLTGYGLVVGLIAILAIAAVDDVGNEVSALFGVVDQELSDVSPGAGSGSGSSSGGSTGAGDTDPPGFVSGDITAPASNYTATQTITFVLDADEDLVANGTPEMSLDIGGGSATAIFGGISAGNAVFGYTVQGGDNPDFDGVEVTAINGLEDEAGNPLDTSALPLVISGVQVNLTNTGCTTGGSATFSTPGTADFDPAVQTDGCATLRVLVVGGGGGGGGGDNSTNVGGGGGSGFVTISSITVSDIVSYTVGAGGTGDVDGAQSAFDSITANGGGAGDVNILISGCTITGTSNGGNGGSGGGGGQGYGAGADAGAGGTNGGNGGDGTDGSSCAGTGGDGGTGQGSFGLPGILTGTVAAGNGGSATTAGGSGGGGVLIGGSGGNAEGSQNVLSNPGAGYGGGGGGKNGPSDIAGRGSDGVVYVEWGP